MGPDRGGRRDAHLRSRPGSGSPPEWGSAPLRLQPASQCPFCGPRSADWCSCGCHTGGAAHLVDWERDRELAARARLIQLEDRPQTPGLFLEDRPLGLGEWQPKAPPPEPVDEGRPLFLTFSRRCVCGGVAAAHARSGGCSHAGVQWSVRERAFIYGCSCPGYRSAAKNP
jgi:hypothetical protein